MARRVPGDVVALQAGHKVFRVQQEHVQRVVSKRRVVRLRCRSGCSTVVADRQKPGIQKRGALRR